MQLVDTSAWIDYLRNAPTRATDEVTRLVEDDQSQVVMCDPVAMELLSGPTRPHALREMEELVERIPSLPIVPDEDFRNAAALFRAARQMGVTPRNQVDCLIAAIAMRHDVEVVHKDADFEALAEVTGLRHTSLRA
ncbi:PIN domain nuclease [Nocardioides sp.]|uniref:type II toxin-antitoxin system VapC family toxin n=1 Tax=Nocardioides sp. TaxID=35761 RepID=UPI0039E36CF0